MVDKEPVLNRMYVYIDFEATGLSRWHDHITQIGALVVRQDNTSYTVLGDFETFVYTDRKICEKASEKTGITNAHLEGAPRTKVALVKFFDWVMKLKNKNEEVVLVAYNGINYDFPLLFSEMHRWDLNIPRQLSACGIKYLLDPLKWARLNIDRTKLLRKSSGNCSFCLGDVHLALIGENFEKAHTALADTEALYKICTNVSFGNMEVCENENYCLDLVSYINEFTCKRRSIDSSTKQNVENKILSLFDMTKRNKRQRENQTCDEIEPKKVKLRVQKEVMADYDKNKNG